MELRRFFVSDSDIDGDSITVRGDEFRHMTKVLRLKKGFKAIVCANDGKERHCVIDRIEKDFATLTVERVDTVDRKSVSLTLFCGVLKNQNLDLVVRKAVELGVDVIVPFVSANTAETRFNEERASRIALESAKQCGAVYLSKIEQVCGLKNRSQTSGFSRRQNCARGRKRRRFQTRGARPRRSERSKNRNAGQAHSARRNRGYRGLCLDARRTRRTGL